MIYLNYLFLLLVALLHVATPTTFHVSSSNGSYTANTSLQFYINNAKKYFISHTQLLLLPGNHFIHSDLIIQNVTNFTITGSNSSIVCSRPSVGINVTNTEQFRITNISFIKCGKNYTDTLANTLHVHSHHKKTQFHWNAALYTCHCKFATIKTVSVYVSPGINGLLIVNAMEEINITNLTVSVEGLQLNTTTITNVTNGIMIYSYDQLQEYTYATDSCYETQAIIGFVVIKSFKFNSSPLLETFQNALNVFLTQLLYNVTIKVLDSSFNNLHSSSILHYYGESCGMNKRNSLVMSNCQIHNNNGSSLQQLILIVVHNRGSILNTSESKRICDRHYNNITISKSIFFNNFNMSVLFSIVPINTLSTNIKLTIKWCSFHKNYVTQLIKSSSHVRVLWQLSHYIVITSTNISSNCHHDGLDLISLTNGMIKFGEHVIIHKNSYYASILHLHLSILKFHGYCDISYNYARNIFKAKEGSYYILKINSKLSITSNTVYAVILESRIHNEQREEICNMQFVSKGKNLDDLVENNETLNFTVDMIDNVYTAPIHLLKSVNSSCAWLADTAFETAKSSDVFSRVVTSKILPINKTDIGIIPASICQCTNSSTHDHNCTSHEIGVTYPGQTLTVSLIVPGYLSAQKSISVPLTLKVATANPKALEKGCKIIEPSEILQAHSDYGCNEYNFTVWSETNSTECELYIVGPEDNVETFYIKLQPCPLGFSLQRIDKSRICYCDNVLNSHISISPCDLNDRTIQRPANHWISGSSRKKSPHFYKASLHCPFDYCLPHSTRLNLITPDQQCQFNRTGLLCGHCQHGLSTVFGSSQCTKCTNIYLLIIIPIAISGILLVLMLFVLNITVTNGAINTFIFYVNIISINISMFFPNCHSPVCIILSLSNLDLGFETCFYNEMDGYAKVWLQAVFPFYMILIALALIMGSRYSTRVQRLTAQRGLPVLATVFLLSYTKLLMATCHVLFFFTFVTHLPSKHSELVWSVDTNIPKLGVKFIALFTIYLILFLILLPFNILLLFTRMLSRFKFINTFKPLLDAYFGPYRDRFFYWTGLQLLMRAVFFGLSALDKHTSLTSGIIVLGILLCAQGVLHPFRSRFKNIQESLILLNLLAVYVAALYNNDTDKSELPITKHLITIVFSYFIIFITCHCITSIFSRSIDRAKNSLMMYLTAWRKKVTSNRDLSQLLAMESLSSKIPDVARDYKEFQEPLIALND